MTKGHSIPSDGLWLLFEPQAKQEITHYLQAHSISDVSEAEQNKAIKKVYDFTIKLALQVGNQITGGSINAIQELFAKTVELEPIYQKLLNLLLVVIEKETGIRSPELGNSAYLQQEVPQLTPDTFLNSRLASQIYQLIESPQTLQEYLHEPSNNAGFVALWMCLKEAIDHQKAIQTLLGSNNGVLAINQHWFFRYGKKRYWLSTTAELLLHRWYECQQDVKPNIATAINQYLYSKEIISPTLSISFIELRQMLKLEYVMSRSALEYGLSSRKVDSTLLPGHVLFRMLNDKRISHKALHTSSLSTTVRQTRSWESAFSDTCNSLRRNTDNVVILEQTTKEQITHVETYTNRLVKENRKVSSKIRHELLEKARPEQEDPRSAKEKPWAWLIVSWLYQLLRHGGKHKKTLRLDTIKSYVTYVSEPFIAEFNGCDPSMMNDVDWAEKLNLVVERIASVNKKAYVVYFAEFLIESGLVPNLCLSDIDLPAAQHSVDANVVTHSEADRVLDALRNTTHPKAELAKLFFIFGFYAGLRRNEIKGLQFKDFHRYHGDLDTLHVRPNKYRELKSTDSSRNLPLDALVPAQLLEELYQFIDKAKSKHISKGTSIFHYFDGSDLNEAFSLLTQVIQGVTGDQTLRFHHCRHSFCNWNLMQFYAPKLTDTEAYPFLKHEYFNEARQNLLMKRLGITSFSRKIFWAVGAMLGHSSPATTTSSYFHLADFLRRNLFANHKAELSALRFVWGQRVTTDNLGRINSKPSIAHRLAATMPMEIDVELASESFDVNTLHKSLSKQSLGGLGLDMYWRILSRTAERHQPLNIANDLNIDIDAVNSVLDVEASVTGRVLRNSKHQPQPYLNYVRLNKPNQSIARGLIKRFMTREAQLERQINLSLLHPCIENFIGAKDSLIRTYDKNSALTLLRFMKLMDFEPFETKVKWYMADVALANREQLKPYLNHLDFWIDAVTNKVMLSPNSLSVVLPTNLAEFRRDFEQRAETRVTDEGKFLAYHAPGCVSIHVKQTRFYSDRFKEKEMLPSMPRRTRAFVSFLRLLVVYLTARGNN